MAVRHKQTVVVWTGKRQGIAFAVTPCLCFCSFSFTVLRIPFAEPPANKKRTRTLFHREGFGYVLSGGALSTALEPEGVIPDTEADSMNRAGYGGSPRFRHGR